jgi:very-short-patch-repair endonuclease
MSDDEEFARDLEAWLLVLPPGAVFTHVTGARLLGWRLPRLPEQVPVFAAVEEHQPRPRRSGLICSRLRRVTTPVPGLRFPVDRPEEILLRASRDLGVLDVLIMLDDALRKQHVTRASVAELVTSGRPGVRVLGKALQLADPKSESAGETVLRMFLQAIDVAVDSQAELHDEHGQFVGRGDFVVKRTRKLFEFDGDVHRDMRQHRGDLRRDRRLVGAAYERSGFSLDDLLNHPAPTMHEIDRLLERPHVSSRLTRWRRLVSGSLYAPDSRQRVMNRWRRAMGVTDWS